MPEHVETLRAFPDIAETLTVLDGALREEASIDSRRVFATDDSRAVDEGLAVLRCYVAIPNRRVRQAVLDLLVGLSSVDPHA